MEDELLKSYLDYIKYEKRLSENTYLSYKLTLEFYLDYLKNSNLKVSNIDEKEILKYLSSLDVNNKTLAHKTTIIKTFHSYLYNIGLLYENPADVIKRPKSAKHFPTVMTEEEINSFLEIKVKDKLDLRNKTMFEVLYATGIRISELLNLLIEDIDFTNQVIIVKGKGKKERIVPIFIYTLDLIKDYLNIRDEFIPRGKNDNRYLFLSNRGNKLDRTGINKLINKRALEIGLNKVITPHTFRHTFATHMLDGGADIRSIQILLGHSDLKTTKIYTHISQKELNNAYLNYHPRGKKEL